MLFTISKSFLTCLQTCISKFCKPWNITSSKSLPKQRKMAAALIREALISTSFEVLCDRVTSPKFIDLCQQKKLDEPLLMNLKMTLLTLFAVLHDAEEKQIVNPAVREWLNELKHAVFDAEDLLDEIDTEALRCKLEGVSHTE